MKKNVAYDINGKIWRKISFFILKFAKTLISVSNYNTFLFQRIFVFKIIFFVSFIYPIKKKIFQSFHLHWKFLLVSQKRNNLSFLCIEIIEFLWSRNHKNNFHTLDAVTWSCGEKCDDTWSVSWKCVNYLFVMVLLLITIICIRRCTWDIEFTIILSSNLRIFEKTFF